MSTNIILILSQPGRLVGTSLGLRADRVPAGQGPIWYLPRKFFVEHAIRLQPSWECAQHVPKTFFYKMRYSRCCEGFLL